MAQAAVRVRENGARRNLFPSNGLRDVPGHLNAKGSEIRVFSSLQRGGEEVSRVDSPVETGKVNLRSQ
jgi:hypothetical protein